VKRHIPYIRLDKGSLVQLGYGSLQRRVFATVTDGTSNIAVDIATDKHKTKELLQAANVPVPHGHIVSGIEELAEVIARTGFPLVIKPNDGSQGRGVTLNINNAEEAIAAYERARRHSEEIVIERYYSGADYRLLVINYRLVAAAKRTPAMVTGDGISSVRELIRKTNLDPLRGEDHEKILTRIRIDQHTEDFLRCQEMTLDSIPAKGKKVYLKQTANLSTGGTSEDVTDLIHAEIRSMAERVARVIGLDICGIDFISGDISVPLKQGKGVVLEVNAAPGFRMHTHPYSGKPRQAGEAVAEMLFPGTNNGRIPIIAITGTNGKTTTTRLIAHIASTAGYKVGYTTTEGIYINGEMVEEGDCTGPVSAERVLRDTTVDFAVLECARGGMLRSGLAFDECDVGIVTNVAEDHLGLKGINTLEEMASVKSIIPESVSRNGVVVLNENNEFTYNMKNRVNCRVALFSANPVSSRIAEHCKNGGLAATYQHGRITVCQGSRVILRENVENIPSAFGGRAIFMIENILAAILAACAKNIRIHHILKALHSFMPSFENNPGRMNLIRFRNFDFMLDYAHNFHGITALGSFIRQFDSDNKVGIISAAGDRRDVDIFNIGKASAEVFDKIIIRIDEDTRGRKESEIIDLLYAGITHSDRNFPVEVIMNEQDAIYQSVTHAVPGSLIVLFSDNVKKSFDLIRELKKKEEEPVYEETLSRK
jgi:cyanophycin synthetase